MTIVEGNDRVIDARGNLQASFKRIVEQDTFGSEIGGDDGIRTHDLLSAIQALFRAELRPHLRGAYLNRTENPYRKSDAQG